VRDNLQWRKTTLGYELYSRTSKDLSVGELLTVINLEIRPSITIKNREIWQINITHAFISNLVPHVFGRLYFL